MNDKGGRDDAGQKQTDKGMAGLIWHSFVYVLLIGLFLFIIAPVLGLRETRTQSRSRQISEEHERRIRETLEYSERERRSSEEFLKRAEKEIFGDR